MGGEKGVALGATAPEVPTVDRFQSLDGDGVFELKRVVAEMNRRLDACRGRFEGVVVRHRRSTPDGPALVALVDDEVDDPDTRERVTARATNVGVPEPVGGERVQTDSGELHALSLGPAFGGNAPANAAVGSVYRHEPHLLGFGILRRV